MPTSIPREQSAWSGRSVGLWTSHVVIGLIAFTLGSTRGQEAAGMMLGPLADPPAKRVTGIGGIFFKSSDPAALLDWYRNHLGIASADWGGFAFQWQEPEQPTQVGYTVWSAFPDSSTYFAPSESSFVVNFRVANLTDLVATLRDEGVEIVGDIEQHPNGMFAWVLDLEGRKVELWEPVPSKDDPYLR